jgi:hypothetical protein
VVWGLVVRASEILSVAGLYYFHPGTPVLRGVSFDESEIEESAMAGLLLL